MTAAQIHHERRIWNERDSGGNIVEHHDVVETWARMPNTSVWTLISSVHTAVALEGQS